MSSSADMCARATHRPAAANTQAKAHAFKNGGELKALLLKDKDLGIDKRSGRLAYACSGLVPTNATAAAAAAGKRGRHLLNDQDGHDHGHHHHHHHHNGGMGRESLDLQLAGSNRQLLELVQANLADPTSYPTTSMGLPLLHSRNDATRKIFLDFDGHTTTQVGGMHACQMHASDMQLFRASTRQGLADSACVFRSPAEELLGTRPTRAASPFSRRPTTGTATTPASAPPSAPTSWPSGVQWPRTLPPSMST
jgi:hypothetical protein